MTADDRDEALCTAQERAERARSYRQTLWERAVWANDLKATLAATTAAVRASRRSVAIQQAMWRRIRFGEVWQLDLVN